jgi:hypothetical protein
MIKGVQIVTDGLRFCVDAAARNSYPGSGTTWADLSSSGNDGTLTNGPTFNSTGYFDLDGSNDYVTFGDDDAFSFGDGSNDSAFSIDAWINMDDATNFVVLVKGAYNDTGEFHFRGNSSDKLHLVVYDGATYQAQLPDALTSYEGQWINVTATYNGVGGSSANAGIKFYINSVVQSTAAATGGGTYTAMENGSGALETGRFSTNQGGSYTYSNGKIACIRLYSKELSQNEINQNFNAQRSRFGV